MEAKKGSLQPVGGAESDADAGRPARGCELIFRRTARFRLERIDPGLEGTRAPTASITQQFLQEAKGQP